MFKVFQNYCLNTNLNGFQYIAQPKRHKLERIFWMFSILTSFILTGFLIKKLIQESQKNPIIIYTDQDVVHVENINFPAVSVCPGIILHTPQKPVLNYDKLKKWAEKNSFLRTDNENQTLLKIIQIASLINRDNFAQQIFRNHSIETDDFVERMHDFPSFFFTAYDGIKNQTMSFFDATWLRNFLANFTQTLWKQGFCYTFNFPKVQKMFHLEKMSKDFNFKSLTPGIESYKMIPINASPPFKSPLPGNGFVIRHNREYYHAYNKLNNQHNFKHKFLSIGNLSRFHILDHTAPKTDQIGYRFIFHDSHEVVPFSNRYFYSKLASDMKILVTPDVKRVDESLKSENPKVRNCYLPNERNLKFLKVYNKVNCEHECLTQMTLERCNCVQFFMVRDNKTRICGARDENCYRNVEDHFDNAKAWCNCYENCDRIKYKITIASTKSSDKNIFEFYQKTESKIIIEISSHMFLAVNKRQSSTVIDLLSLSGGFLGLFAGFSVLSAVEIFYYFCISPFNEFRARMSTIVYPFNEEIREKKNDRLVKRLLKKMLQESSIHSSKHIGNDQKSLVERITWTLLFAASMICAYFMIIKVYEKTTTNAVAMTMEGLETRIEDIPFPAITIQATTVDKSKYFDFFKYYKRTMAISVANQITSNVLSNFTDLRKQTLALICGGAIEDEVKDKFYNFSSQTAVKDDFKLYMNSTSQLTWFTGIYAMLKQDLKAEFTEIMTKYGVCYTTNMVESSKLLKRERTTDDFKYSYPKEVNYPIRKTIGNKMATSITFVSRTNQMMCTKNSFAIHSPFEFPTETDFVFIDIDKIYHILISPSIIKADDDLRSLSVESRKCYFENEKELKFFKIYTQQNCEFECLAAVLYEKCNCVPFYFIRSPSWDVCEYRRMKFCVKKYLYERSIGNVTEKIDCGCLPACNSISYKYEIIDYTDLLIHYKTRSFVMLIVHFKYSEYYALMRYQSFKLVDFLSYVGGILGLFAGISVLSFVEILYFITLRLITDLKRQYFV